MPLRILCTVLLHCVRKAFSIVVRRKKGPPKSHIVVDTLEENTQANSASSISICFFGPIPIPLQAKEQKSSPQPRTYKVLFSLVLTCRFPILLLLSSGWWMALNLSTATAVKDLPGGGGGGRNCVKALTRKRLHRGRTETRLACAGAFESASTYIFN